MPFFWLFICYASQAGDDVPSTYLETQNTDSESIHQQREQPRGSASDSERTGTRYRDDNELTARNRNINSDNDMDMGPQSSIGDIIQAHLHMEYNQTTILLAYTIHMLDMRILIILHLTLY